LIKTWFGCSLTAQTRSAALTVMQIRPPQVPGCGGPSNTQNVKICCGTIQTGFCCYGQPEMWIPVWDMTSLI